MPVAVKEYIPKKCILTELDIPFNNYKDSGKFYNTSLKNFFRKCGKNLMLAKSGLSAFIYIEELDMFFDTWKGCSTSLGKNGIDKKPIYNKYFIDISSSKNPQ